MNQNMGATTDSELSRRVSDALEADKRTALARIEVIAERGLITLGGEVESPHVRRLAEEIARAQPGVIEVVNDLGVLPEARDEDLVDMAPTGFAASGPVIVPDRDDK